MLDSAESYVLLAFGDIEGANTKILADRVFTHLFGAELWYVTRTSRVIIPGPHLLFYQNGTGFRGDAVIQSVAEDSRSMPFGADIFLAFSLRISLIDTNAFSEPVDARSIVESLDVISNKKYWGHAFRSTARSISKKDYFTITRCAVTSSGKSCLN